MRVFVCLPAASGDVFVTQVPPGAVVMYTVMFPWGRGSLNEECVTDARDCIAPILDAQLGIASGGAQPFNTATMPADAGRVKPLNVSVHAPAGASPTVPIVSALVVDGSVSLHRDALSILAFALEKTANAGDKLL
ncbi:hypothetical protein EON68_02480, partial [archaeon]